MSDARKVKVSVTLSQDLLTKIDREATREKTATRSSVMENWLRHGARQQAERELEAQTIAYYEELSKEERRNEERLAKAMSTTAKKLAVDGSSKPVGSNDRTTSKPRKTGKARQAEA
jgi:metal-responsive CopG/Arc/MetJ family transcriptional regulator